MNKFIEIGINNPPLSTEIEFENGTEIRRKGVLLPCYVNEMYIRIWIYKYVLIVSTKDIIKISRKTKIRFKLVIGFKGQ